MPRRTALPSREAALLPPDWAAAGRADDEGDAAELEERGDGDGGASLQHRDLVAGALSRHVDRRDERGDREEEGAEDEELVLARRGPRRGGVCEQEVCEAGGVSRGCEQGV